MLKFDQHVHTYYSGDSKEDPREHIKRGMDLGLDGITFTDHIDYDYPYDPSNLFEFDVSKAFEEFAELQERYIGSFDIGRGLEIGLRAEDEVHDSMRDRLNALVAKRQYDAIIGSVHLLNNQDVFYREYWEGRRPVDCLWEYFKAADFCLKFYDCFDIFGHFDYIVRYAPAGKSFYVPSDYSDIIESMLKTLVEKGKALEVNTKSLKPEYGLNAPNPGKEIIKRYLELGGELITVGSDAHKSADLACCFERVQDLLQNAGVKYYAVYKNRKPVMFKL